MARHKNFDKTKNTGASNPKAKLNDEKVKQISCQLDEGKTVKSIAKAFEISETTIFDIRSGRTWNRVTGRVYNRPT